MSLPMNMRLKMARVARRWTQIQLAKRAQMDQQDISRIENGWVPPTPVQQRLAKVLDMDRAMLFDESTNFVPVLTPNGAGGRTPNGA